MTTLVSICLLLALAGLTIFAFIQHRNILNKVDSMVLNEAKNKGLIVKSLVYPSFREWKHTPFEREIKVGTIGFEGIPYSREYYRIVNCIDTGSKLERTIWIKATRNYKTKEFQFQWRDQD